MKKIISIFIAAIMFAAAIAAALPSYAAAGFSDVEDGRWSASSIGYAVNNGYMKGVGGGKFDPEGSLTRAMVATVLWRREGSPAPSAPGGFSDVPAGEWYADAVAWAKETGVVKGLTETTFGPDEFITREQLATMLFRFSSSAPVSVPERADLDPFADDEKVSDWATEPLEWAVEAGLIKGTDGNRLAPDGFATREQFAAIIERYDGSFILRYNTPVIRSHYTEKEYPLVTDADIYVSPNGDDGAAGDFDHPIASFGRAVEMVRALKETVAGRSVVVAFKAGKYHEENVTMTAEDSGTKEFPVIYCAYGDGEAVITGGVSVTEDAFLPIGEDERSLFPEKAADKIKKTYVGGILPGYGRGDVPFSEDGVMTVARYPNKFDDGSDHLMQAGFIPDDDHVRITNAIIKKRIDGYHTLEGLQLYGYLTTGWYKDTLDTAGYTVDGESGGYDFLIPDTTQARMGRLRHEPEFPSAYYNSIALQNIPEELDHDGEYWVDADTLTMYVYDPRGSYTFPLSDNCIVMDGCDHVTFRGLTLTGYRDKILQGSGIVGLSLDRCRFSVCSSEIAITVNCRAVPETEFAATVTGCDFSVFAGRVLVINGRYLFDNNRVSRTNLTIEMHAALYVNGTAVFSHNEFEDCSYMAIGYNGCDNVIEYNTFKNCMYNSQDGGVIYCGQSQGAWGSVIRYNVFYPTEGEKYAVYLDDDKPAEEVCGNILFDTTICVHDGRSNNIHDNVMIRSDVSLSVGGVIELYEEYFETGDPGVFLKEARFIDFYTTWKGFLDELDADPVMKERYFSKYPELSKLTADLDRAGDPDFVLYPRNYVRDNIYVTGSEKDVNATDGYSVVEGNKRFTLKENPIFVNPTKGDYRLKDGVDFFYIPYELMGRY